MVNNGFRTEKNVENSRLMSTILSLRGIDVCKASPEGSGLALIGLKFYNVCSL